MKPVRNGMHEMHTRSSSFVVGTQKEKYSKVLATIRESMEWYEHRRIMMR